MARTASPDRTARPSRRPSSHRGFRWLAGAAAVSTYLLIVFGGVVRITGSGMGCGDDWPLCNGAILPPMDLPTMIEYGHRLAALAVSALVVGTAAWAWLPGRGRAWRAHRRLGLAAVALLVIQILLGAVTVWLELPPASVILHLGTAMALLAVLVVTALRRPGAPAGPVARDAGARTAVGMAGLGFAVVLAGALVANLGAATACRGFPLCDGAWWPAGGWRTHLHWGHRLLAYLLAAAALVLPAATARFRPRDRAARAAAWSVAVLAVGQVGVAAWMMLADLPGSARALHVGLGAALFGTLVGHAWLLRRPERAAAREASTLPAEPVAVVAEPMAGEPGAVAGEPAGLAPPSGAGA